MKEIMKKSNQISSETQTASEGVEALSHSTPLNYPSTKLPVESQGQQHYNQPHEYSEVRYGHQQYNQSQYPQHYNQNHYHPEQAL